MIEKHLSCVIMIMNGWFDMDGEVMRFVLNTMKLNDNNSNNNIRNKIGEVKQSETGEGGRGVGRSGKEEYNMSGWLNM